MQTWKSWWEWPMKSKRPGKNRSGTLAAVRKKVGKEMYDIRQVNHVNHYKIYSIKKDQQSSPTTVILSASLRRNSSWKKHHRQQERQCQRQHQYPILTRHFSHHLLKPKWQCQKRQQPRLPTCEHNDSSQKPSGVTDEIFIGFRWNSATRRQRWRWARRRRRWRIVEKMGPIRDEAKIGRWWTWGVK